MNWGSDRGKSRAKGALPFIKAAISRRTLRTPWSSGPSQAAYDELPKSNPSLDSLPQNIVFEAKVSWHLLTARLLQLPQEEAIVDTAARPATTDRLQVDGPFKATRKPLRVETIFDGDPSRLRHCRLLLKIVRTFIDRLFFFYVRLLLCFDRVTTQYQSPVPTRTCSASRHLLILSNI